MLDKPHDNGARQPDLDHILPGVHEKNPHDLLGGMTRTDLPRNVVLAAILTFLAMGVLSAGPYFYNLAAAKMSKPVEKAETPETTPAPKADPSQKDAPKEVTKTNPDPLDKQPAADSSTAKPPKGPDPLEKLGVSETKSSDPKKNPLEKGVDDLLKDIK